MVWIFISQIPKSEGGKEMGCNIYWAPPIVASHCLTHSRLTKWHQTWWNPQLRQRGQHSVSISQLCFSLLDCSTWALFMQWKDGHQQAHSHILLALQTHGWKTSHSLVCIAILGRFRSALFCHMFMIQPITPTRHGKPVQESGWDGGGQFQCRMGERFLQGTKIRGVATLARQKNSVCPNNYPRPL